MSTVVTWHASLVLATVVIVFGAVFVRELAVLASIAASRLLALRLKHLRMPQFVQRHLPDRAKGYRRAHDVDEPHQEEDNVGMTAADRARQRRMFPVDATQDVTEGASQSGHDGEGAEPCAVVLGHTHVDEVGATRRLTRVAAEVEQHDADDREQDAPRVTITDNRSLRCDITYSGIANRRVSCRIHVWCDVHRPDGNASAVYGRYVRDIDITQHHPDRLAVRHHDQPDGDAD